MSVVVEGSGSGEGVTSGGGGSVGCGSGAVMVGAVDAGGSCGFFFLQADENIIVAASINIAAVRTALIVCCSDPVRIRSLFYSAPRTFTVERDSCADDSVSGSTNRNVVPFPTSDSNSNAPLCNCNTRYVIARPIPLPAFFVV